MKKIYALLTAICFASSVNSQTASFNITYTGFTPQAQAAFEYSANIWAHTVVSAVPIKVLAHFTPLLPTMLGITFPNGIKDFAGAPHDSTWYATSLANSITGTELNPGQVDIEMYLNSTTAWYYDSTGAVPTGQYDLCTIVLHELCHGLGFLSLAKKTGTTGSFGMLLASDFAPLTTSFPWPQLDTMPSAFDRFLVNAANAQLDTFINPSTALGTLFTGNQIYFNGPNALAANSGLRAKIDATGTFSLGSSITHLSESMYPAGNINELMTPNGTPAYALHNPGPICNGILKDIGWTVNATGVEEFGGSTSEFRVYPNPAKDKIAVTTGNGQLSMVNLSIYNSLGEKVLTVHNSPLVEVADLPKGVYFIIASANNFRESGKFVKE